MSRAVHIDARAQEIAAALRTAPNNSPLPRRTTHRSRAVTAAFAATTRAAVGIIVELNRQITDLEAELATHFEAHPDADIYLSLPVTSIAASVATSFATLPCAEFRTGLRLREAVRADLPTRQNPRRPVPLLLLGTERHRGCPFLVSPPARAPVDEQRVVSSTAVCHRHRSARRYGAITGLTSM